MSRRIRWMARVALLGSSAPLAAQDYPHKPIRWIIDFPAAGVSDILAHRRRAPRRGALASPARTRSLPDVPTFGEHGVPFESLGYAGAVFPAGVATNIVAKMNAEIGRVVRLADVEERIYAAGGEPRAGTPEEFAAYLRKDVAYWAPAIRAAGAPSQN